MNMKNNLIQNFYIIGITPDDISTKMQDILSYTPKIISKFPDIRNYNTIPNELIIEHCFPMGYKPLKGKKKDLEKNVYNFWFELDNLKYNYLSKYQMLYSKKTLKKIRKKEKKQMKQIKKMKPMVFG